MPKAEIKRWLKCHLYPGNTYDITLTDRYGWHGHVKSTYGRRADSPKRSGGDPWQLDSHLPIAKKGVSAMKWQVQRAYWKVALILGAIASFILAAGANGKWT